jgi:hypothetical protein
MANHVNESALSCVKARGERRRLKVTPKHEATIHRLKAAGQSITAIAKKTGLSRPTVYDVLGNAPATSGDRHLPNRLVAPWCRYFNMNLYIKTMKYVNLT